MDYTLYEPEDFAADESYLRYYFRLNGEDIRFWEQWIRNHPEKLDVIIAADRLIGFAALHLPEEEFQQELERMNRAITAIPEKEQTTDARPKRSLRRFAMAGAAVLILLVTILFRREVYTVVTPQQEAGDMVALTNSGFRPMTLQMEDGSTVVLEAGAHIRYPQHFSGRKRDVYLDGDARFDVSKDPDRPFYVYCNNLVTHVLGTSFHISTNRTLKQVEVAVISGKVEVYEHKATNGVILTPNQKATYTESNRQLEASVVEDPLPVALPQATEAADSLQAPEPDFVFSAASLREVLQTIERVYGITIEVENERFNNCHFSGDISGMDFNARMEAICQVLHATYETRGTKILIKGEGCK
jgi:transmembrane sensor